MSKVVKKILNIIIDIIVILILVVSVLVITLSLTSRSSGVPNIFGYAPLSVQSDSMKDTFSEGDLIFSKVSQKTTDRFEKGDIVTFVQIIDGKEEYNTHRIIEVVHEGKDEYYRTQGDNKETNPEPDKQLKAPAEILAVYTGTKIGGIGHILSFLRTQQGFLFCILLPMIAFFVYEAIRVIMNIMAYNKEKAKELAAAQVANSELTEEQKQRAIEEYLAQQKQSEETKQDGNAEVQTPASEDAANPEPAAGDSAES